LAELSSLKSLTHAVGHKYLGANQNYSEEHTIAVPAGISQLGQGSSDSRGLFSALQQFLQNTETKLARLGCHHGKFWHHNIETKELCTRKHNNMII